MFPSEQSANALSSDVQTAADSSPEIDNPADRPRTLQQPQQLPRGDTWLTRGELRQTDVSDGQSASRFTAPRRISTDAGNFKVRSSRCDVVR